MGPNLSFFRFVKHVMRDSSKMSYTDHFLSSSSSLKKKRYFPFMVRENLREVGQFFEKHYGSCLLFPLNMAPICVLSYIWVNCLSLSHTNPMSHYTPSSHPKSAPIIVTPCFGLSLIQSMLPSHLSCLTMFKGSFNPNQPLCNITNFHPRVSLCSFDLSYYNTFLCQFRVDEGDTSWPSFDESVPVDFNTLSKK
jgi:hypothetical protein